MKVGAFELAEPLPELHDTRAVAILRPWIDVGRAGSLVLGELERFLAAKELGRLARPGTFFDFTRYRPYVRYAAGRRVITTPNSVINYVREHEGRSYLFFHLREPHSMAEDYIESIVAVIKAFNVTEYCRVGAMYDAVPHTRRLLVTGSLTSEQEERVKGRISHRSGIYQGPTSILGLLGEHLELMEVQTPSLMAHLPQYVQLDEDHMGACRLMEVVCSLYGLPTFLANESRGQQQYAEVSRMVESNPEVKALITQLEAYYDRTQGGPPEDSPQVTLSPDVERFLRDVGRRLEERGD